MNRRALMIVAVALCVPAIVLAQGLGPSSTSATEDTPYQIGYAVNLHVGDSIVNITNSGASSTTSFPLNGNICANVYVIVPAQLPAVQEMAACCSCLVRPGDLVSLSVKTDLVSNTLTSVVPKSIIVKLLATSGGSHVTTAGCNILSAATAGTDPNLLTLGMAAYGTTLHTILPGDKKTPTTYGVTETKFTRAALSSAELGVLTNLCKLIVGNGSGTGMCGCGPAAVQ